MRVIKILKIAGSFGFLFASFIIVNGRLGAFQSEQVQSVAAGAFVGGEPAGQAPLGPLKLRHTNLNGVSGVTKEVIIQGEAGDFGRNFNPLFRARLTPDTTTPDGNLRVRLFYRFISPGGPPDTGNDNALELLPILGSDPFGFAFQVPPSSLDNGILQYRIVAERLQDVGGTPVVTSSITHPATTPSNPFPWVTVGIVAQASLVFDENGGRFALANGNPNVGQTELNIPAGALSGRTTISIDELDPANPIIPSLGGLGTPVAIYKLDADQPANNFMQLSILYPDFVYPSGQTGRFTGTTISERAAGVAWWDGFSWRRLGATINDATNTITTRIKFFTFMAVVTAGAPPAEDRRPLEKIITPNGDGHNDSILFAVDGGEVRIFDVRNHTVRTLSGSTNPVWDGRDDNGRIVESGVYIYQYEADGKRVSGLIAVAK